MPRGSYASTRCACASPRIGGRETGADPLRIRIYSDIHLEYATFVPPEEDADVVVLAGDIANGAKGIEWARETFRPPVLYLAGNHEYYEGEFEAVQAAMR